MAGCHAKAEQPPLSEEAAETNPAIQFAGALEFGPEGTLFVGDNLGGAIHAFELGAGEPTGGPAPVNVDSIDVAVGSALGVGQQAITVNDMAVHPTTHEVYLSVSRRIGSTMDPAIVKVDHTGRVLNVDLSTLPHSSQALGDMPDSSQHLTARGMMNHPPSVKDLAKAAQPSHVFAIMDLEFYKGELFVSGVSNEEFSSTLRRMPYPFSGEHTSAAVRMFHVAHDKWETRAPIRSMLAKNLDGTDYLIAAYTCSPIVLIPIDDIEDGASLTGRTIGDMGNGQPIDMVSFDNQMAGGSEYVFVTNLTRSPQIFALDGLADAKAYTDENTTRGMKMDAMGVFPIGPVGNPVMFVGTSLQVDVLNDQFFVSITRDPYSGSLNLESLAKVWPATIHYLEAEVDFSGPAAGHGEQR
jgi:hypothetical protein